jgi:hypothetical protein
VPHDDVIDVMGLGKSHDLFRWMPYRDVNVRLERLVRVPGLDRAQHILVMMPRLLDHGLRLNHSAKLGRPHDR